MRHVSELKNDAAADPGIYVFEGYLGTTTRVMFSTGTHNPLELEGVITKIKGKAPSSKGFSLVLASLPKMSVFLDSEVSIYINKALG